MCSCVTVKDAGCRSHTSWHNSSTNKNEGMYMNLNPLATAALVMIGLSQVSQAWTAIQPTPQETSGHYPMSCSSNCDNS